MVTEGWDGRLWAFFGLFLPARRSGGNLGIKAYIQVSIPKRARSYLQDACLFQVLLSAKAIGLIENYNRFTGLLFQWPAQHGDGKDFAAR